jgi:hypothetical protein
VTCWGVEKLKTILGSTPVVVMVEANEEVSLKLDEGCELIAGVVQKSAAWPGCPKDWWKLFCIGAGARFGVCH